MSNVARRSMRTEAGLALGALALGALALAAPTASEEIRGPAARGHRTRNVLSLIHISEPTRR